MAKLYCNFKSCKILTKLFFNHMFFKKVCFTDPIIILILNSNIKFFKKKKVSHAEKLSACKFFIEAQLKFHILFYL